jgi:hypothetical protein
MTKASQRYKLINQKDMHAHTYIQCTRGGWDEILMSIEWKK